MATIAAAERTGAPEKNDGVRFLQILTENDYFKNFILVCILANAITLGIDAQLGADNPWAHITGRLDQIFLGIFTAELVLEFLARPKRYFRDGWNWFDVLVVGISYLSVTAFSALRTLRVFRVLRLFSAIPQLRRVVEALIKATPGILGSMLILIIVFYIGAVMATTMFGDTYKEDFGGLGESALTLFQLANFDAWGETVRKLNQTHPYAWAFLVIFDVFAAFAVLNLFIGVIVDAVQEVRGKELEEAAARIEKEAHQVEEVEHVLTAQTEQQADIQRQLLEEVRALREEVRLLRER